MLYVVVHNEGLKTGVFHILSQKSVFFFLLFQTNHSIKQHE